MPTEECQTWPKIDKVLSLADTNGNTNFTLINERGPIQTRAKSIKAVPGVLLTESEITNLTQQLGVSFKLVSKPIKKHGKLTKTGKTGKRALGSLSTKLNALIQKTEDDEKFFPVKTQVKEDIVHNGAPDSSFKTASGSIKRPMNAFMLWSRQQRKLVKKDFPEANNSEVSIKLGEMWAAMTEEEKKPFYDMGHKLRREHSSQFPDWSYNPRKKASAAPKTCTSPAIPISRNLTISKSAQVAIKPSPTVRLPNGSLGVTVKTIKPEAKVTAVEITQDQDSLPSNLIMSPPNLKIPDVNNNIDKNGANNQTLAKPGNVQTNKATQNLFKLGLKRKFDVVQKDSRHILKTFSPILPASSQAATVVTLTVPNLQNTEAGKIRQVCQRSLINPNLVLPMNKNSDNVVKPVELIENSDSPKSSGSKTFATLTNISETKTEVKIENGTLRNYSIKQAQDQNGKILNVVRYLGSNSEQDLNKNKVQQSETKKPHETQTRSSASRRNNSNSENETPNNWPFSFCAFEKIPYNETVDAVIADVREQDLCSSLPNIPSADPYNTINPDPNQWRQYLEYQGENAGEFLAFLPVEITCDCFDKNDNTEPCGSHCQNT